MAVEVHDAHLAMYARDEEWIALVARRNWVAVTRDKRIRYRRGQFGAIKSHRARVIVIRNKSADGPGIADLLVSARRRIADFVGKTPAPFIAGIDRSGRIYEYDLGDN